MSQVQYRGRVPMLALALAGVIALTACSGGGTRATRESLQDARRQLDASNCNLVCLQVADMPNFESTAEVQSIIGGIEAFLKRDTRRVSGVILTNIGVVPQADKEAHPTFRTKS